MLTVILVVVAFLVGGALSYGFFKYGLKSKYDTIIKEAETEAEVIKKNKRKPKAIMIRTDLMAINGALERTLLWSFSRSQRFVPG